MGLFGGHAGMQPARSVVRAICAFLSWLLCTALVVDFTRSKLLMSSPLPELNRLWLWIGWAVVAVCTVACIRTLPSWLAGKVVPFKRRVRFYVAASVAVVLVFELSQMRGLFKERRVDGPSMIPALVGRHWSLQCSQCGFRFAEPFVEGLQVTLCPLCRELIRVGPGNHVGSLPGERIFIDRLSRVVGPRRWQIWAYRLPEDPDYGQVKRVVGLPGEQITLCQGDVWVNGMIARKSLQEFLSGATLVFDSQYINPQRQRLRYVRTSSAGEPAGQPTHVSGGEAATDAAGHLGIAHWWIFNGHALLRQPAGAKNELAGRLPSIETRSGTLGRQPDSLPGVELPAGAQVQGSQESTTEDVEQNDGTQRILVTPIPDWPYRDWLWESELEVPSDAVLWWCYLGPAGSWTIQVALSTGQWSLEAEGGTILQSGKSPGRLPSTSTWYFGFFDNQLLLVAGHREIVRYEFPVYQSNQAKSHSVEAPLIDTAGNGELQRIFLTTPQLPLCSGDLLALGSLSGGMKLHRVRIWRDVYYVDPDGRGVLWQSRPLRHDEYFLLGDNATNSLDSRQLGPVRHGWLLGRVVRCR